ncbi:MAG: hypothetical protein GY938_24440 [Ketobacter sp.]|nr:hypothetical protein [Ketobacter sp.]
MEFNTIRDIRRSPVGTVLIYGPDRIRAKPGREEIIGRSAKWETKNGKRKIVRNAIKARQAIDPTPAVPGEVHANFYPAGRQIVWDIKGNPEPEKSSIHEQIKFAKRWATKILKPKRIK